jgi:hypothetical protein
VAAPVFAKPIGFEAGKWYISGYLERLFGPVVNQNCGWDHIHPTAILAEAT